MLTEPVRTYALFMNEEAETSTVGEVEAVAHQIRLVIPGDPEPHKLRQNRGSDSSGSGSHSG